jgi:hypothetical protein
MEVPTAGVPTYLVGSPLRAREAAVEAVTVAAAGAAGAAAAGVAGSPSRAVISASLSAGKPLRPRRACSAAMVDLLHLFPAATHFATASVMPALGALVAAAEAGEAASPLSHSMDWPAFNASISASVSSGRPLRWRHACSIPITQLLSAFLDQGERCPRKPFTTLLGESSAIRPCPLVLGPKLTYRLKTKFPYDKSSSSVELSLFPLNLR